MLVATWAQVKGKHSFPFLAQCQWPTAQRAMSASSFFARLCGLPSCCRSRLDELGINCTSDVAGMTRVEWASLVPDHVEGVAAAAWMQFWLASQEEFGHTLAAVDVQLADVVPVRAPLMGTPVRPAPLVEVLPPSRKRPRGAGLPASVPDTKKLKYIELVVGLMQSAGPLCTFHQELQACSNEAERAHWRQAFSTTIAARFEIGSVRAAWRAWRRWLTHAHKHAPSASPYKPSSVMLHTWLSACGEAGPTVACSLYYSMCWLRTHCGLTGLPLDSPLIASFRAPAAGHVAEQAPALCLKSFRKLVELARPLSSGRSIAAALVLRWLTSGLRHAHAVRASHCVSRSTERQLVLKIARGKSQQRAAFFVAVPWYLSAKDKFFARLQDVLEQKMGTESANAIFLPDIASHGSGWQIVAAPLPISRAQTVIRDLLGSASHENSEQTITTYALRRFLPTVAESLLLTESERSSLGNWVDRVSSVGQGRQREPMHVRYSDSRLEESANVKRVLLQALSSQKARSASYIQELSQLVGQVADYRLAVRDTSWGTFEPVSRDSSSSSVACPLRSMPAPVMPRSSSGTSSGSSSSSTSRSLHPPPTPTHPAQRWLTPKWKGSAIHIATAAEGGHRLCRDSQLDWGWEEGFGPAAAALTGRALCQACLRRTSPALAAAFREARHD